MTVTATLIYVFVATNAICLDSIEKEDDRYHTLVLKRAKGEHVFREFLSRNSQYNAYRLRLLQSFSQFFASSHSFSFMKWVTQNTSVTVQGEDFVLSTKSSEHVVLKHLQKPSRFLLAC